MKNKRHISLLLLLSAFVAIRMFATTPTGEWVTHMSYVNGQHLAISDNKVYCVASGSLFSYGLKDNAIETYDKISGLNDVYINDIAYSSSSETLVICYDNGNIDLMNKDGIVNIPDIKLKSLYGDKSINKVDIYNKYAYISTGFGIVKVNIEKEEIAETYKLSNGETNIVYGVAFLDNKIYAATDNGIFKADMTNNNLQNFANWSQISSINNQNLPVKGIITFNNNIIVAQYNSSDKHYYIRKQSTEDQWNVLKKTTVFSSFFTNNNILTIANGTAIRCYDTNYNETSISSYNFTSPDFPKQNSIWVHQAISVDENTFYVADQYQGLIYYSKSYDSECLSPKGPATNTIWDIDITNNVLRTVHGATTSDYNNTWTEGAYSTYRDNFWTYKARRNGGEAFDEYVGIVTDPQNVEHFFITSFGYGVIEYKNDEFIEQYTDDNSTIINAIPGSPRYYRTIGMAFDNDNNLWINNSSSTVPLHLFTPEGDWYGFDSKLLPSGMRYGTIVIDDNNSKWVATPYFGDGIFVYNENETYDDDSDDSERYFSIKSSSETISDNVYDIAMDNDGTLWVGSDNGVALYYSPTEIFSYTSNPVASRITIPRNDGTGLGDYLLDGSTVQTIAVDGGNRKWLGTASSGVYLVSPDGLNVVHHFTEENSALLSDNVRKIEINHETGEVFFATEAGLISYQADATQSNDSYDDLKVYPNPVREDFYDDITITGLIDETTVKITDVTGNLVNQMTSNGGTATWDATNFYGKRVGTGVYLIFCSNSDGSQSAMTKVLVIN